MSSPASSSSSDPIPVLHGGAADTTCQEYALKVPLLCRTTGIDTLLHDAVSKQSVTTRLQSFSTLLGVQLSQFRALVTVIIGLQKTGKSTLSGVLFDVPAESGHHTDIATTLGADAFIRAAMVVIDAEGTESVNRMDAARELVRQLMKATPKPISEEMEEESVHVENQALSHTRLYDRRLWAFSIAVSQVVIMVYKDLGPDFRLRMLMLKNVMKNLGTFHHSDSNGCGRPLLILVRNQCPVDVYLAEKAGLSDSQRETTQLLTGTEPLFCGVEWRAIPLIEKTAAKQDPFPKCPGGITAAIVQTYGGAPDSPMHRALTAMLEVRTLAEEHMAKVWATLQHLPHGQLAVLFQTMPAIIKDLNDKKELQSLLAAGLPIAERLNEDARASLLADFCATAALTLEVAMSDATFAEHIKDYGTRYDNLSVRAPTQAQVRDQLVQQMRVEFDTKLRACPVGCGSCGHVCQLGRIGHSGVAPHPTCPQLITQPCALQCSRTVTRPCGLANGSAATRPDCGVCCASADRLQPSSCALHLDTRCSLPHGHTGRHSNFSVCCCSTSGCIFQHPSPEGPPLPCIGRRGHEDPHTCDSCCLIQCAQHKTVCMRPKGHLAQKQSHSCGQPSVHKCADGCNDSKTMVCGDVHPGGCCCVQKCAQHNLKCTRGAADHGDDHRCPQCCTGVCAHGLKCVRGPNHVDANQPHSCGVPSLRACTNQGCTGSTERMCGEPSPTHCCANLCSVHPGAKCTVGFGHNSPHRCSQCCPGSCVEHGTLCTLAPGHAGSHVCGQSSAQPCPHGCGVSRSVACGAVHPADCCCPHTCAHGRRCEVGVGHDGVHRCPQCCTGVCAHGIACVRGSDHLDANQPHSCGVPSLRACTNEKCTGSTERMCGEPSPTHCCANLCSVHPGAKCTVGFNHGGPHRCAQCCPGSCGHGTLCTLAPGHAGSHVCSQSSAQACPHGCGVSRSVACGAVHPADCCCPLLCAHGRKCTVGAGAHSTHRCLQCCPGVCVHGAACVLGSSHQSSGSGLTNHSCGLHEKRACTNGCGVELPSLVCGSNTDSHCCPSRCGVHGDTKCIHGHNHSGRHECVKRDVRIPCMHKGCGQSTPSVLGCTPADSIPLWDCHLCQLDQILVVWHWQVGFFHKEFSASDLAAATTFYHQIEGGRAARAMYRVGVILRSCEATGLGSELRCTEDMHSHNHDRWPVRLFEEAKRLTSLKFERMRTTFNTALFGGGAAGKVSVDMQMGTGGHPGPPHMINDCKQM